MSHSTSPGSQQCSDEELEAIAGEAHWAGIRGDRAVRACVRAGIDCTEQGFPVSEVTLKMMADHGTFLVSTTCLTDAMDIARGAPELRKKAAEVFPVPTSCFPRP